MPDKIEPQEYLALGNRRKAGIVLSALLRGCDVKIRESVFRLGPDDSLCKVFTRIEPPNEPEDEPVLCTLTVGAFIRLCGEMSEREFLDAVFACGIQMTGRKHDPDA